MGRDAAHRNQRLLADHPSTAENNYFDRCDGEVEIVSVKSGLATNYVAICFTNPGGLALRHGNNNLVEANVFLGNGVATPVASG